MMDDDVYERLVDALDKLPNGFPRTQSRTEIRLLRRIFSLEEASLACQLRGDYETADEIAKRLGLSIRDVSARLSKAADRGFLWSDEQDGKPRYRLAPFVVGIYESQLEKMDAEFAHLVEKYFADGGAAGIMKPQPALHRVIPALRAVKTEWVMPYDDVKPLLLSSKTFNLHDCICRSQQEKMGRRCSFPIRMCFSFSSAELPPGPNRISRDEALSILDKAEEIGLVHTVSNVVKGIHYVCNCCGCCCGILRGINDWGIENSVARANYYSTIDPEKCTGCGKCLGRCQVHAISELDGVSVVDRKRCIGCGLCVTGCPSGAAKLQRKPDSEISDPPLDFTTWERERLHNRGLIE